MKTVVCSSTWVACLYRMSYSLFHSNLSVLLLSAFQTGHLMWAGGGGGRGLFRCGDQRYCHPASDVASICSQVPVLRQRAQCSGLGAEWEACWRSLSAGLCGFSALTRRGRDMPLARAFTCFWWGWGGWVGVEVRGATTFWPRIILCMYLCGPVCARASAASKCLPCLLNEHLSVFSRSRSSALMGHLPLH